MATKDAHLPFSAGDIIVLLELRIDGRAVLTPVMQDVRATSNEL